MRLKFAESPEGGHKMIAVGTTSIRTLETIGTKFKEGRVKTDTDLRTDVLSPGYQFSVVEGFITFHLPKSTLIMLVSAFAGHDHILAAYQHAVEEKCGSSPLGCHVLYEDPIR